MAVPIAKKTSRAQPRISPTTDPVGDLAGVIVPGSVVASVAFNETFSNSGSVVIRALLGRILCEKWNCHSSRIQTSFPEPEFFCKTDNHPAASVKTREAGCTGDIPSNSTG